MIDDGDASTGVPSRQAPPTGSGLAAAEERRLQRGLPPAGRLPVVTWTINDKARMLALMRLGVNGIISDRPDLLRAAVEEFDANRDGQPGDFLDARG